MSQNVATARTLKDLIIDDNQSLIKTVMLVVLGTVALWISAKIQVPFYPVPMTMQTFVVLTIGFAFGARLGALTVGLYLLEGAMGLPVFAGTPEKGLGLPYMLGPTGGYLLGFFAAASITGWLAERGWDRSVATTAGGMMIGLAVIYALGLLHMGNLLGWDKPLLEWGLYPFLFGEAFKVALAAAILPALWKLLKR